MMRNRVVDACILHKEHATPKEVIYMRRLTLLGVSILTMIFMVVSPAFAHDWDGDGWDEEFGF